MFQAQVSLLDMVTILIAFSSVMLLLSVLVTTLAQATQAALRLRARNLRFGVAAAIGAELPDKYKPDWLAREIMNSTEVSPLKQRTNPHGPRDALQGPVVSWIDKRTLEKALQSQTLVERLGLQDLGKESLKGIVDRFGGLDLHLQKRFKSAMRAISLIWSVLIAVIFQVSAPMLLEELSRDPETRARYAAMADEALEEARTVLPEARDYAVVSTTALDTLAERHPDLRAQIEEASGIGSDKEDIAGELGLLLRNSPERDAVLHEYDNLLDEELKAQRDRVLAQARTSMGRLSYLDITPWRFGSEFYVDGSKPRMRNALGVLMTAVLLSLGAPAWFKILQNAVAFRDILSPQKVKDRGKGANATGGETTSDREGGNSEETK